MKTSLTRHLFGAALVCVLFASAVQLLRAEDKPKPVSNIAVPAPDVSFRNELLIAIDKGLESLKKTQSPDGNWSKDHPAITALALTAFQGEPNERYRKDDTAKKGYEFLTSCAKPDGGIYQKDLANYNTSISMMALLAARNPEYDSILRKARQFVIGCQMDLGEKGKIDNEFDGGIGYGVKADHADLNNTLVALEALHYSQRLQNEDKGGDKNKDLNFEAAIHFIQKCQNLPDQNKEAYISDNPKDKGGFFYYPGRSMAGAVTNAATGKVALRSYGTASYAGLLSYAYADMKRDDSRVTSVMEWLKTNYTVDENPGMRQAGLYYYLHLMTKALTIYGTKELQLNAGKSVEWRNEVAMKLINLQKPDGSWVNENGRWLEKDQTIVTAYSVIALEMIYRSMMQ